MTYNYFVAYDLCKPGQNYDAVIERVRALGACAHMQLSMHYVQMHLTLEQLHRFIREVMDPNDRLAVIWARDAFVSNYDMGHLEILRATFQRAA